MKQSIEKGIEKYGHFVAHNPIIVLVIVALITFFAFSQMGNVKTTSMNNRDSLPKDIPVIETFQILEDSFGSTDSVMVAVSINPRTANSNEIRDIRDYRAIRYIDLLTQAIKHLPDVQDARSISTHIKSLDNDVLPLSTREIISLTNPVFDQYINKDKTMSIINIDLADNYDSREILTELQNIIDQFPKPPGVKAEPAGDVLADPIVSDAIGPDMGKTSNVALLAIIIILFLLFRSIKDSLTPLAVIAIGVVWAMGYMGLMRMGLNPATSGVISMIMGIGIDFGIQIMTRFKQEWKENTKEEAMKNTMKGVFMPMLTTTLAALIGFKAMSMGQLTVMAEFGKIMSYGITACFFTAITVVPSLLMLTQKKKVQRKLKNPKKIIRQLFGG